MLIHQATLFLNFSRADFSNCYGKLELLTRRIGRYSQICFFIVHICSCPFASNGENQAVVEAGAYHCSVTRFPLVSWKNGTLYLSLPIKLSTFVFVEYDVCAFISFTYKCRYMDKVDGHYEG